MEKDSKKKSSTDLDKFLDSYRRRIKDFLESDPETKIVFLNADFGWGKTTFIKDYLMVKEHCIYSPWLNKSSNYLEEIYYNVSKTSKSKIISNVLFWSAVVTVLTILSGSFISLLTEIFKDDNFVCRFLHYQMFCTSKNQLVFLLFLLLFLVIVIIVIIRFIVFKKPIPFVSLFKKDSGKYYENELVQKIVDNIEEVLVIEDIDRAEDIEEIFIVANKISQYMKDNANNKYILFTGDYIRTINRINSGDNYNKITVNSSTYEGKGFFLVERLIAKRINFSSISARMTSLFVELGIDDDLSKIEKDEITSFIKKRYLNIRLFIKFLNQYKALIDNGYSMFHLLLKFYQEEKYFNIYENEITNTMYSCLEFPVCLNDIEMLLQKDVVRINGIQYQLNSLDLKETFEGEIIDTFIKTFIVKEKMYVKCFKDYYTTDLYPVRNSSFPAKQLFSFLVGCSTRNSEMDPRGDFLLPLKRCYFDRYTEDDLSEMVNFVEENGAKEFVDNKYRICAYLACFFKKHKNEIEKNYPKIYELILSLFK